MEEIMMSKETVDWLLKKKIPQPIEEEEKPKRKAYVQPEWFAPYLPPKPSVEERIEEMSERQLESLDLNRKQKQTEAEEERVKQLKEELKEEFEDKIVVRIDNEAIREEQIRQMDELNKKIRQKKKELGE